MKKNYTKLVLATALFFCGMAKSNAQTIALKPTGTGSEGNTLYSDNSTFQISAAGVVSYTDTPEDWTMTAETITQAGALGKNFKINWGGMATVNITEGSDYGKMLSPGGIDRASDGNFGIRGINGDISITTANGISNNEGLFFGLDLSNLGTDVAVQITKISVVDLTTTNETGIIVSLLDPTKRINFGQSTLTGGAGIIDVSSLKLYVIGGSSNNSIVSIFNNSVATNNWRISGIELKIVPLSTLPVSFGTFTATAEAQGIKLQWKTLSEQDNKEFIILRSADGNDFIPVTTIAGAGNSSSPKSYQFYDRSAVSGINYYKLLQVDNDGRQNEVAQQAVRFALQAGKVSLFPNPSSNEVSVAFKPNVFHTLFLTNLQGRVLHTVAVGKDVSEVKLDLRQYAVGTYVVKLQGVQTTETSKLIKR